MIRLREPGAPALRGLPGQPVIAAQMEAMAASAGGGVLREFWEAGGPGQVPSGWLCRSGDSCWALAQGVDAAGELAAFLALLNPGLVQCCDRVARALEESAALPGRERTRRPLLRWRGEPDQRPPCAGASAQIFLPGDPGGVGPLMELHTRAGEVPRGERWDRLYAELHLRCRRKAAAVVLVRLEGNPAAAAALGSIGTGAAVVSHVCTLPEFRRRGAGSLAVLAACRLAREAGRDPVLCCRGELLPFYRSLGFEETGEGHWILRTGENRSDD